MKLKPVRGYKGAKYPTLERHLLKRSLGSKAYWIVLGAALVALAAMTSGCGAIQP